MDPGKDSRKRKSVSPNPAEREKERKARMGREGDYPNSSGHKDQQQRPAFRQSTSNDALARDHNHHHHHNQQLRDSQKQQAHPISSSQPLPATTVPIPKNENYEKYKSLSDIRYPWMRDVSEYDRQATIGRGTFGEVYKAKSKGSDRVVALKKILMENEKEGFPITALREIKILQQLRNENVVELIEICSSKATEFNRYRSTFYIVFEFCEHDLAGLLSNRSVRFTEGETKKIMNQLLNGLFFIHTNKVLHRDMKTSNILINRDGILKIADFGLARAFSTIGTKDKPNRFTNRVVTLWYRPPELLFGERNYTPAIDMWGAGCIMCELWTRTPILQGQNEQHQLQLISHFCGSITPEIYPDVQKLELFKTLDLPKDIRRDLKNRLKKHVHDNLALDLIDRIFTVDPSRRIDADSALNHDYFWSDPMPHDLKEKIRTIHKSQFEFTANHESRQHQQAGNRAPSQQMQPFKPPAPGAFGDRVF